MLIRVLRSKVKVKTKKRIKRIKIERESIIAQVMKVKDQNY
jgi:hypothetical protein